MTKKHNVVSKIHIAVVAISNDVMARFSPAYYYLQSMNTRVSYADRLFLHSDNKNDKIKFSYYSSNKSVCITDLSSKICSYHR